MRNLLILLIMILFGGQTAAQELKTIELSSDENINRWLHENNVPVSGVGIIEDSRIKEIIVFGELEKDKPAPVNTLFNIASQTKPVVAMLTLKLIESGQWELDEPLSKYWIDPDVIDDTLHHLLTTRHVLSHQTGFVNWRVNEPSKKLTFHFIPGTKFQYSGEGFEYLRRSLENKLNKPLDRLLDSVVFKPLGMMNTQYWSDSLDLTRFARWYDARGKMYSISYQTGVSAADDLITTIEDYCKFGIDVINGAGLSEDLFNEMVTPQSIIKENSYYGLGWGLIRDLSNGEYAIHHGGSDMGVRTMAIFLPQSRRGVIVMTNGDMGMFVFNNIIRESIDVGEEILNTINRTSESPQIISLPAEIIDRYTGDYQQPNGRFINVSREGNAIKVSGEGIPTALLYPEAENKFFLQDFDVLIEFVRDSPEITMHLIIYENGEQTLDIQRIQ